MCPSSGLWGWVLDYDSKFTILSPPSFDGSQLWRSISLGSSLYLLTRACSPLIPLWLASYLLAPAGGRTQSPDYALHISVSHGWQRAWLFFLLVHQAFWAWCRSRSQPPIRGYPPQSSNWCALSTPMMLLCCSFSSASFTSRNPSSLFVDRSNSKIYLICRAPLIANPSGRLPQKRFTKKDSGSRLYRASWLFFDRFCHLYILCLLRQVSPLMLSLY